MVLGAFATCIIATRECRMNILEQYSDLKLFQLAMVEDLIIENKIALFFDEV